MSSGLAEPVTGGVPAGGLPQQKRNSCIFHDPVKSMPPYDMCHLMREHKCDLVPLSMAHIQQEPTHEDRSAGQGNSTWLRLGRDRHSKGESFLRCAGS